MSIDVDLRELAIDRDSPEPAMARRRRHVLTRVVFPVLLILGFIALISWASRDLLFPPRAVTVVPVLSTMEALSEEGTPLFNAAGWVEPRPTPVRVAALAPGVIESLLVVEDQPVEAGEPIAQLVNDDAQLGVEKATADLELRQAEREEANAALVAAETRLKQPVHLQAALGEAEAALASIQTQLGNMPFEIRSAEAEHAMLKKSYEGKVAAKGVVAGVDIDAARTKADNASTLLESLHDRTRSLEKEQAALIRRRDALRTQLHLLADEIRARDVAAARVKAATAREAQARVAVAEAELQLNRMTIVSPIDGRVFRLIAEPGANLALGIGHMGGHDASTVVTLYRPDRLQVRVDVRFEDIPRVSLNQRVVINNPALGKPLNGKVLFISSEADIQKNTLQVKVEITEPPPVLKPEMLVDVTFLAPRQLEHRAEHSQARKLYVLTQLLHQDDLGPFVWLADQSDGVARKIRVETGRRAANGLVEINRGLNVSSRLISGGMDGLQDGHRIRVVSEDPVPGSGSISGEVPSPSQRRDRASGKQEARGNVPD